MITKKQIKAKPKLREGEKLTRGKYKLKAESDNRLFKNVTVLHVQSSARIALIKY